jgi:hypothetical protein
LSAGCGPVRGVGIGRRRFPFECRSKVLRSWGRETPGGCVAVWVAASRCFSVLAVSRERLTSRFVLGCGGCSRWFRGGCSCERSTSRGPGRIRCDRFRWLNLLPVPRVPRGPVQGQKNFHRRARVASRHASTGVRGSRARTRWRGGRRRTRGVTFRADRLRRPRVFGFVLFRNSLASGKRCARAPAIPAGSDHFRANSWAAFQGETRRAARRSRPGCRLSVFGAPRCASGWTAWRLDEQRRRPLCCLRAWSDSLAVRQETSAPAVLFARVV